jgi:hypothetical protein
LTDQITIGSDDPRFVLLWSAIDKELHKKYKILSTISFPTLDHDPKKMFHMLAAARKDVFQSNEKILVLHYDTDYYVRGVGFTLQNFLRCLKFLDISPSAVLFFTNHHGIQKEIKNFYLEQYVNFDTHNDRMMIFENNYVNIQSTPHPLQTSIDIDKIHLAFSCLLGRKRTHRVVLLSQLQKLNIVDKGMCSWNAPDDPTWPPNTLEWKPQSEENSASPEFLITQPFQKANEHWPLCAELVESHKKFAHLYDQSYKHPKILGLANANRFDQPALKQTLVNVVVETVFQYPYPYISEKTFRPILHKRPFILIGAAHTLQYLKSLGFKTFQDFWNEDYDAVQDASQRMLLVVDVINKISFLTVAQLQELCYNMREILEHNFDHYIKYYAQDKLFEQLQLLQ